jgi:hypothetical protein
MPKPDIGTGIKSHLKHVRIDENLHRNAATRPSLFIIVLTNLREEKIVLKRLDLNITL